MVKIKLFVDPFKPVLLRCLIYLVLEGGHKFSKIGLAMGLKIEGGAAKSGKNTHLLVIICMRLSQKMGLLDFMNQTQFKKVNG